VDFKFEKLYMKVYLCFVFWLNKFWLWIGDMLLMGLEIDYCMPIPT
jgi:hypothetical protein